MCVKEVGSAVERLRKMLSVSHFLCMHSVEVVLCMHFGGGGGGVKLFGRLVCICVAKDCWDCQQYP